MLIWFRPLDKRGSESEPTWRPVCFFTDVLEPQTDLSYPDGYRHDASLDAFRKRLKSARYFVFDEQAVAMAASVAQSKPSSIVACLPFVRLPAPIVWIEFSNQHVRQAMASLGSPNIRPDVYEVDIERTGFLLSEEAGCIKMDYIHKDRVGSRTYADMAPIQGVFDPSLDNLAAKVVSAFAASVKLSETELELHGSTGRLQNTSKIYAIRNRLSQRKKSAPVSALLLILTSNG